jgi:prolyl oligopeptidase
MEALSLHKAIPDHHLQISIAQKLEGLPEFRSMLMFTAFEEG